MREELGEQILAASSDIELPPGLEATYYPVVSKWARDCFQCFATFENRGISYGRVDVLGVRDVGGDLSGDVETISIEVKRNQTPFASACGQALGYRVMAHRVYLADARRFTSEELFIASHLGVGLIEIVDGSCMEKLSSPFYEPITRLNLALLEGVGLCRCQCCGSFFPTDRLSHDKCDSVVRMEKVGTYSKAINKAHAEHKGLMFWNDFTRTRKNQFHERRQHQDSSYDRRYICADCVQILWC